MAYCSYDDNGVVFDLDTASFEIFTKNQRRCIKNAKVTKLFCKNIIAVRKKLERPQLISTSRHITQGAAEIENIVWSDENLSLTITSNLVADDEYTVTVYAPKGYVPADAKMLKVMSEVDGIYEYKMLPDESKAYEIKLGFLKA